MTLTKEEIAVHNRSVMCSIEISTKDEELDLPSLHWIPKLHKFPCKQSYIIGSAKMPHAISFQIINIYSINGQNCFTVSVTLDTQEGCESDVDS